MTDALDRLIDRAMALPEPYNTRAMGNIGDADRDLVYHPLYAQQILADCEWAIVLHEADAERKLRMTIHPS